MLSPLVKASVDRALRGQALDTVTGPAARNDRNTLLAQQNLLHRANPDLADLHAIDPPHPLPPWTRPPPSISSSASPGIEAFVFDNDGVFTNGTVFLMPGGEQVRTASTRDGYAVQHAAKCGVKLAMITGGRRMKSSGA